MREREREERMLINEREGKMLRNEREKEGK